MVVISVDVQPSCRISILNMILHPLLQVKTILGDGLDVEGYGRLVADSSFESNVPFILRFMVRHLVMVLTLLK